MGKIICNIISGIGILICIVPMIFWFINPEMTSMQIFIKHWIWYLWGSWVFISGRILEIARFKGE